MPTLVSSSVATPAPRLRSFFLIFSALSAIGGLVAAPTALEDTSARAWRNLPDGGIEYDFAVRLKGDEKKDLRLSISPEGMNHFKVTAPASVKVAAGREISVPIQAALGADEAKRLLPFTPDQCRLVIREEGPGGWKDEILLRLATAGPFVPPGKDFVAAVRARTEKETWAKAMLTGARKKADASLATLGSPIEPPTEGNWIQGGFHILHWPKYVTLTTDANGVKTCAICEKSWTPGQLQAGGERLTAFRESLGNLALVAMVTGEDRYAQAVRDMLLGLARAYLGYEVGPQQTRLGLNYMIESRFDREAIVAIRRLQAAGMLSDEDLKKIAEGFLIPSLETVMDCGAGTPNIMMLRACTVGQAGLVLNWPPYVAWALRDESKGMVPYTAKLIGDDGGWLEGSLSYHMTTHLFLTPLPVDLKLYGYDVMTREPEFSERLRKFYRFPMLALRPDRHLVAIADAGLSSPSIDTNAGAYWLTREPAVLPWLNKNLEFAVDDTPKPPQIEFKSRNFPDFGVAVLHDGGAPGRENWVLVRHGAHMVGHGHFDVLNAVAYVHGQPLHDDLGSVYADPRHWSWLKNTVSHCTINIDEMGQMPTAGKLEVFNTPENGPQVLFASADGAREGVRLERAVGLVQGVQLYVDRAVSAEEHTFDWIFTSYGKVAGTSAEAKEIPPMPGNPVTPEYAAKNPYQHPPPQGAGYEVPQNLREMNVSGNWWIDWQDIKVPYGKSAWPPVAMRWMAWSSGPARVVWGDSPGMNLKPDLHRWVMARQKTREAVWVTAMVPQSGPPLVDNLEVVQPAEGRGIGVHLKSGEGGAWIAVNWQPGQPLKVGPITTTERIVVQP
jgi:hypothetical protein